MNLVNFDKEDKMAVVEVLLSSLEKADSVGDLQSDAPSSWLPCKWCIPSCIYTVVSWPPQQDGSQRGNSSQLGAMGVMHGRWRSCCQTLSWCSLL